MEATERKPIELKPKAVRGQAAEFLNWGIYLVILGIILAVGSLIFTNFQSSSNAFGSTCIGTNTVVGITCVNPANTLQVYALQNPSPGYNSLGYGNTALQTVAQYLPLVALVVVASGIIMLVVRAFSGGIGGRNTAI